MAVLRRYKRPESDHSLIGMWHIYEMENWDEDYFNMKVQAYIEITPENMGEFQFGLVSGSLDGYLKDNNGIERFAFTWGGNDEMDEASGSRWLQLSSKDQADGLIKFHGGVGEACSLAFVLPSKLVELANKDATLCRRPQFEALFRPSPSKCSVIEKWLAKSQPICVKTDR
jgi:hypothetical protein